MTKKRYIFALAVILVLTILSMWGLGWLTRTTEIKNETTVSDFELEGMVYFLKSQNTDNTLTAEEILANTPYTTTRSPINVNITNPNADNYIGNLRVMLKYSGASPSYIRVRVLEQWTENDEFIPAISTPYTVPKIENIFIFSDGTKTVLPGVNANVGNGWFDNREKDLCFYYNGQVYPKMLDENLKGSMYMLAINGITPENLERISGNLRQTVELKLIIEVQAVQPNRYREFFGIDKLPWE